MVLRLGALLLGEQLHRRHVLRRRQPGHRRPVHQERAGSADLADDAEDEVLGATSTRSTSSAATTCRAATIPRPRRRAWYSPAYHTASAKWTSHADEPAAARRRLVEQPRVLHEQLPGRASSSRAARRLVHARSRRTERDIGGSRARTRRSPQTTQSPTRYAVKASASYVTGSHNIKVGFQRTWGTFFHTIDANGDLYQQLPERREQRRHRRAVHACRDTVVVRNTPVAKRRAR